MLILLDTYSFSSEEINTQMAFRVATLLESGIEVFYQEGYSVCGSDNNKPLSCLSLEVKVLPGREIYLGHGTFEHSSSWVGCCAKWVLCISIMPVSEVSICCAVKHQQLSCLVMTDVTYLLTLEIGVSLNRRCVRYRKCMLGKKLELPLWKKRKEIESCETSVPKFPWHNLGNHAKFMLPWSTWG